ncbi:uncharacterized protein METZ01_LOCUS347702 [marine metagenome]|uniref:Uncharacterized protein n=1 Tax=marine metagenome TaxID=408172 RepID=A0A382RCW9_9ZZZZ
MPVALPSLTRGISKACGIRGGGAWSGRRDQGGGGLYVGGEFFAVLGEGPKVAFDLEAVPKVLGLTKEDAEADGHGGSDGAPAKDDFVDGAGSDADGAGHGVLGNAHGAEVFLQKNFSGCDWWVHDYNA